MRFAKRSSTRAGLLVLAFAAAALLAVVSLAANSHPLTLAALALTIALAGVVAAFLIVTERRRHEAAERELTSEARFLECLSRDWPELLPEYERLYAGRAYLPSGEQEPVRTEVARLRKELAIADRRSLRLAPEPRDEQLQIAV